MRKTKSAHLVAVQTFSARKLDVLWCSRQSSAGPWVHLASFRAKPVGRKKEIKKGAFGTLSLAREYWKNAVITSQCHKHAALSGEDKARAKTDVETPFVGT